MKELDKIDLKILEILENNARMPVKEIANQVFLSSPAVTNRIERLEKAGVITGYHADINFQKFGFNIRGFINLQVDPKRKQEFYSFIEKVPNVIESSCVTGDYSMMIEVVFRYTEEMDHLINELQQFGRTKTQIVFTTNVEHRSVPLSEI